MSADGREQLLAELEAAVKKQRELNAQMRFLVEQMRQEDHARDE